jgi:hypothetical protein
MLVELKNEGVINKHIDEGHYADTYMRFHIPIKSDDGSEFHVELEDSVEEVAHMRPGDLWWFNHKKPHFALNVSSQSRVHLIVDLKTSEFRKVSHQ